MSLPDTEATIVDDESTQGKETRKQSDADKLYQGFRRVCSPEELWKYKNTAGGPGGRARKAQFMKEVMASKLKSVAATSQDETTTTKKDTKVGKYMSLLQITEKEGGAVDAVEAKRVALNYVNKVDRRGHARMTKNGSVTHDRTLVYDMVLYIYTYIVIHNASTCTLCTGPSALPSTGDAFII